MDIKTHDLLKLKNITNLITHTPLPDWVHHALKAAPYAVVRRDFAEKGTLSIGIRGKTRSERYGCFISNEEVIEHITPEQLALQKEWKQRINDHLMKESLELVDNIFRNYNLAWGPVGSVGFELATGFPAITKTSDLDLIIRTSKLIPVDTAKELVEKLAKAPVRVDVQIEIEQGAISLLEYARDEGMVLLRTKGGPRLVKASLELEFI